MYKKPYFSKGAIHCLPLCSVGVVLKEGFYIEIFGNQMRIVSGLEKAEFSLKGVTKAVPHEPTEAELAEEARRQKRREQYWRSKISWDSSFQGRAWSDKDIVRTGQLFLQIEGYGEGVRWKWADGKTQTMETLIPFPIPLSFLERSIVGRSNECHRCTLVYERDAGSIDKELAIGL